MVRDSNEAIRNVAELLRLQASLVPDEVAFVFVADTGQEEVRLSFRELDLRARAVAAVLENAGAQGERAFLLYPSGLEYLVAFLGCLYAGVVAVPAYPPDPVRLERTLPRLRAILRDAGPKFALTTAAIRSFADGLVAQDPALGGLTWLATDTVGADAAADYREADLGRDSLAFLQYTSGSTGQPKGVMLTHGNLLANLAMVERAFGMRKGDRVATWLPPYHDMGLIGTILQPIHVGGQIILMSPLTFLQHPIRWLEAVTRYQATVTGGPNFGYELCVRKIPLERRAALNLSSLEVAFVGAEPIRARTLEAFTDAFAPCGFRREAFLPCYGLAEATLLVTGGPRGCGHHALRLDKARYEQGVVVPATPSTAAVIDLTSCGPLEVKLDVIAVDPEERRALADGEVGEIWIAGKSVAPGYWQRPDETGATFGARLANPETSPGASVRAGRDYLRTGDLGFVQGGELYICGRSKDLIIIRGRNLHPQDIEAVIEPCHAQLRPGCTAAFSVDAPDGERLVVVAEVSRVAGGYSDQLQAEITRAIRQAVSAAHDVRIDEVVLVAASSIPKTSSGKIQRRTCRADYLAGTIRPLGAESGARAS